MQQFPVNYNDNKSYGQLLNHVKFYVQALGFDMNISSPQLMTVIEPGVSMENPDSHKLRHPCDQLDFMNFFLAIVKQTRQSLLNTIVVK